jgi:NTE family protein
MSLLVMQLAACVTFNDRQEHTTLAPATYRKASWALVLGSGCMRGLAHIGVLQVLEQHGLAPDLIVGCSAGAVIGGAWAAGLSADAIEALARKVDDQAMPGFTDLKLPDSERWLGMQTPAMRRWLPESMRQMTFAAMPRRFVAVATDLDSGEALAIGQGHLATALEASTAIAGWMSPPTVLWQGQRKVLVDCAVSAPLPVAIARALGAERVVAVDVAYEPQEARVRTPWGSFLQAFHIALLHLRTHAAKQADVVIRPDMAINVEADDPLTQWAHSGRRAALQALGALQTLVSSH